jgi:hypothetical protein
VLVQAGHAQWQSLGLFPEAIRQAPARRRRRWGGQDDQATTILRNCRSATHGDGRALVVETAIGEIGKPDFATLSDMGMLCVTGGIERDLEEFDALFAASGWRRWLDSIRSAKSRSVPAPCSSTSCNGPSRREIAAVNAANSSSSRGASSVPRTCWKPSSLAVSRPPVAAASSAAKTLNSRQPNR